MDTLNTLPGFDETAEMKTGVCPEGQHDVSIEEVDATVSKNSGKPMLVVDYVVDSGEAAGHTLRDYIPITTEFGQQKLKTISVKAGYEWTKEGMNTLQEFADQFFKRSQALRLSVMVRHKFSLKLDDGSYKDDVSAEAFENYEGDKYRKADIARYLPAEHEKPELIVAHEDGPEVVEQDDTDFENMF